LAQSSTRARRTSFGSLPSGWEGPFLVGTIAAAGVGLIAIDLLLGYLRRHDYTVSSSTGCALRRDPAPDRDRREGRDVLM
jgi:hypothetical protein